MLPVNYQMLGWFKVQEIFIDKPLHSTNSTYVLSYFKTLSYHILNILFKLVQDIFKMFLKCKTIFIIGNHTITSNKGLKINIDTTLVTATLP